MSDEKSLSNLDNEEQKQDDKNDNVSYSMDDSSSQISIGHHHYHIHRWMIVAYVVLACLLIAIAVIALTGMIVGFIAHHEISRIEQHAIARDAAFDQRLHDLELYCMQCNSSVPSSGSDGDQYRDLLMDLKEIRETQSSLKNQLKSIQLSFFNQSDQIITLKQQTQENISQIEAKVDEFGQVVTNISEHVNHLTLMRDEHSDQLNQIRSNLTNFSTQLTRFNGSFTNLISGQELQRTEILNLTSSISTLNSSVSEIDRRDRRQASTLQQSIKQLGWRIDNDNISVSNQLNTIDGRLDTLDEKINNGAAAIFPIDLHFAMIMALSLITTVMHLQF